MIILKVEQLTKTFGGLVAIQDLDFEVEEGSIKAVIGPNGAGKTTLFNLISGILPPTAGEITFKNREINRLKPHERCALGIGRTFQLVELFGVMTVLDNIMVGCHTRTKTEFLANALRLPSAKREEELIKEKSGKILDFLGILDL